MARFVEQANVLDEALVRLVADGLGNGGILERAGLRLRAVRAVGLVALEQVDLLQAAIIYADERAVLVNRPGDRVTLDLEIGFDVADQLERILADAVALVDEREDGSA